MQLAKAYCREIFEILKVLKVSRDMSVMEIKLIVSIEDPRAKERRAAGIEVGARRPSSAIPSVQYAVCSVMPILSNAITT